METLVVLDTNGALRWTVDRIEHKYKKNCHNFSLKILRLNIDARGVLQDSWFDD